MSPTRAAKPPLRERRKAELREVILDAFGEALQQGRTGTYAEIAELSEIGERTVYRYFPSRDDLLRAMWTRVSGHGGFARMPQSEADLTELIRPYFTGFDSLAPQTIAVLLTEEGRRLRKLMRPERVKGYLAATREAAKSLPESERRKAAAAIQALHSGYTWLQMREEWGLDGEAAAEAVGWAIDVLLKDLRRRGARRLSPE